VTDAGIPSLAVLKQLQKLVLQDSKLTDKGKQQLKAALPTCEIVW
jgi:hypothetical protein